MRKITLALILAGAGSMASMPAFAQDSGTPFNGPRVEALAGYDHLGAGSSVDDGSGDDNIDGVNYGVGVGYDANLGSFVLGVEGEFMGSSAKTNRTLNDEFGFGRVKAGRDLYVGARAGILASPDTLVYVKGGYTNQKLNILSGTSDIQTNNSFKLDGWRLGAGVEHQFGTNVYGKLEYRYSNYTDAHINFANGEQSDTFDVDADRHQIVAGVGFRF